MAARNRKPTAVTDQIRLTEDESKTGNVLSNGR
jgi:hypothetical protein